MVLNALQRLSQVLAPSLSPRSAADAVPPSTPPIDVRCLQARWHAEYVHAATGFMALRAVRQDGCVVDFEVDIASTEAVDLLRGGTPGVLGPRLQQVLAGHAERLDVFDQYRRVLEVGAATANHRVEAPNAGDVLCHAAVRLSDGVAVRLTNVSALRRLSELQCEIASRALIGPWQPSYP
jgi:hypothetical protein